MKAIMMEKPVLGETKIRDFHRQMVRMCVVKKGLMEDRQKSKLILKT